MKPQGPSPQHIAIDRAAEQIAHCISTAPETAMILGSGLAGLAHYLEVEVRLPFAEIPGFCQPTAAGHPGQLVFGRLTGRDLIVMAGRFHRYEGYSHADLQFPVQVLARVGARRLIVSNAAGGLNSDYKVGDLVVLQDHLDWLGTAPASTQGQTPNYPRGAARHVQLYDRELAEVALEAARHHRFPLHRGTYLATTGPNYETPAEYRMMQRIGADLVGMSTAPEVLAAAELGVRVLAISLVSNLSRPDRPSKTAHSDVLAVGRTAVAKMKCIVDAVLNSN